MTTSAVTQPVAAAATTKDSTLVQGAIFLSHLSVDMQTGSLAVLLPLLLAAFQLDYTGAAAIVSINSIVIAISQPLFGILGDRKQMRWLVYSGCLLCGAAMSLVMFMPAYWLVIMAVIFSGLGSAMFHPEALAVVRAHSGAKAASSASYFFFFGNLGFAFGPMLASWLTNSLGNHAAVWMIAPTLVGMVLLTIMWRPIAQPMLHAAKSTTQRMLRSSPRQIALLVTLLLTLIAVRSLVHSGLQTFIPLYFHETTELSDANIALMVSTLVFMGVFGTLLSGPISERIGRRAVMVGSIAIVIVALYGFMNTTGWLQLGLLALTGTFATAAWPISVVMVQEAMPNNVGLASGLTLGLAYGAGGLGVAGLGRLADAYGLQTTMTVISLLPILALVMSLFVPERIE